MPQSNVEFVESRQYLTLQFRLNAQATESMIEVQTSVDFSPESWRTVTPDVKETLEADPLTGDPRIRVKVDVTGQSKKFIRLKVNQP